MMTSYDQMASGLHLADHLIALGEVEREMLTAGFLVPPEKISVVHNGIGDEFFTSKPEAFRSEFGIDYPFVLHTGLVGDVKNQLGLIRALKDTNIQIVLIGRADAHVSTYLQECLHVGGSRVRYLGELTHGKLLASAYAAASVVAIPSRHEGMPNTVLEALAAGRAVVMTNNHSMDLKLPGRCVRQVAPDDLTGIRSAVEFLLQNPPSAEDCTNIVRALSWSEVAGRLREIYSRFVRG